MIAFSKFTPASGAGEYYFSGTAECGANFAADALALLTEYSAALEKTALSEKSERLLRFHLSDVANQTPILLNMLGGRPCHLSIVGQPPVTGRIALEAWHWDREIKNYDIFFTGQMRTSSSGAYDQTAEEFEYLSRVLGGGSLLGRTIRTWLYCRDVDNNYAALVKARNDFFAANGITSESGFIASTGIEGAAPLYSQLVHMDSLNCRDLAPGQIVHLKALENLSPTALYGVSFERASRVVFGDRSHYFISGTASIDKFGKVLYENDVVSQTARVVENIAALLTEGDAGLSDLKCATVYLRDTADAPAVLAKLAETFPAGLPMVTLKAPVCRPTWLVEVEALAVNCKGDKKFKVFE